MNQESNNLTMKDWICTVAERLKLSFDNHQSEQFLQFISMIREWNDKINLTAILDDEGIAIRHLLDSLTLVQHLDRLTSKGPDALRLIDVGSGAGFPGIPLKLVRPGLEVVLLDSLRKRTAFLEAVVKSLGITGIKVLHGRAEDAARLANLRERFDAATARAVAPLPVLCEYCLPFVRVGGVFLAMKGPIANEAVQSQQAIKKLGGELVDIHDFNLPGTDMKRTLLTIQKRTLTPAAYPRTAGKPEKEPL